MRRWLSRIARSLLIILLAVSCLALWALQQTRAVPAFYAEAASPDSYNTDRARHELEVEVEHLQKSVQRNGSWSARFSDDQINAWLESALVAAFPKLLPNGVSDPRVVVEDDHLIAAARYKNKRIETIVSCEIRVALTEEPNIMAVRIDNLRAGTLALPLDSFLKKISSEVSKSDIEVRWDKANPDQIPVALVSVPSDHESYVRTPVIVESVQLKNGYLTLTGHTGPEARRSFNPSGPIYHLASLFPVPRLDGNSSHTSQSVSANN